MLYHLLKTLAKVWIRTKFKVEVEGKENIPSHDRFILAANHLSNYDAIVLTCVLNKRIYYLAKIELFKNKLCHWFFSLVKAIPVDRKSGQVIRPIRAALRVIENGETFGIFPEGTRCKNKQNVKPKKGVAFLALKSQTPVLPVSIVYDEEVKFRKRVRVVIAPTLIHPSELPTDYEKGANQIMEQVRELKTKEKTVPETNLVNKLSNP
ncbi:lysophospholipid acyltransferase family protein [Alkalibacillus aidingensis]|uniref:lysophospholipid acyltransferase family protein n=1 Tax=Alkalibacillus aidingensis TaxID=2747607 RepID=UPI001660D3C3|nr:lysophospholipid acyltransferase family protein [Alkalibacillus aidingensis]